MDRFKVVDVDATAHYHTPLPPQITHVPSIMTTSLGRTVVFQDAQLDKFVNILLSQRSTNGTESTSQAADATIQPCIDGKCSYAFLDGFESLDEPDATYSTFQDGANAGMLLDPAATQAMQENAKLKEGDASLDQLMSLRNADLQKLIKSGGGGGGVTH